MTSEKANEAIIKSIQDYKALSEQLSSQLRPLAQFSEQMTPQINSAIEPMRKVMAQMDGWSKAMYENLKPTLEIIHQIQVKLKERNDEAIKIRREIVTSAIDLDEAIEEILLKKYFLKDMHEEISNNLFNDEGCSSIMKLRVLNRSGLINEHDGLKKKIQTLYEIRNLVAHSKYFPTVETIQLLHKDEIKDIKTLKKTFDEMFGEVKLILEVVSKKL